MEKARSGHVGWHAEMGPAAQEGAAGLEHYTLLSIGRKVTLPFLGFFGLFLYDQRGKHR